jgi:hypothetical protein
VGNIDKLGKELMRQAAGPLYVDDGPSISFDFGPEAGSARIDGTVGGLVAVEIESRTPKQVRGALVDLVMHPYPKKLRLLLPVYTGNPTTAVNQAHCVLGRFLDSDVFRIVCVTGDLDGSIRAIRTALGELGIQLEAG